MITQDAMDISADELLEFLKSIQVKYGYDFTGYSEASLKRRVINFMGKQKINTISDLAALLLNSESHFEFFIQELSVTVTEMFRDPYFFRALREKVLPRLATYPVVRIWVAGCATGEEVYSMAILLKEENLLDRSIIYATDINRKSLQIAREGIYSLENMKSYTTNYMKAGGKESFSKYYQAKYDLALFDKSLRQNVVFAPHNLTADKVFNEFQLITCRNVLIYFTQQLQNQVLDLFYESLCPFGFLGLGTKESLLFMDKKNCFQEGDEKMKIFIKTK
jgi:chemotaxis protein methyltransferase CheR